MASLGDYDVAGDHAAHHARSTLPNITPDTTPSVDQLAARLAAAERRASAAEARAADAEARLQRIHTHHHTEERTFDALDALLATAQLLVSPDAVEVECDDGPPYTPAIAVGARLAELTARVLGCDRVAILAAEQPGAALRPLASWGVSPEQEQLWRAGEPEGAYLRSALPPDLARRLNGGEALIIDYTQPSFRDLPNPHGLRTLLLAPMRLGEQLVGILNADFSGRVHDYTPEELRLAGAVAQLGALVVEREWLQRARAEAQASAFALRETNQRMDAFLSIASHELRTPLTTIKANLQIAEQRIARMLEEGDMPPAIAADRLAAVRSLLVRASASTERQTRLVRDLLDVSRIQAGRLTLHPTPTDLAALLRDAVDELCLSAPDRIITLALPPGLVLVAADAEHLRQVITSYLSNAIKYSRREQVVAVSLTREAGHARVAVRDHGPGIAPDEQPGVWERFYRVPGAEHQYGSGIGLGLGLYIAREIVERHGGSVTLSSTPGEGSTFIFTIPLSTPPDITEE